MIADHTHKQLFMIGGPNGAGKSTLAFTVMPEMIRCSEYLNADAIAASLAPFHPDLIAMKAGRIMLNRIKELVASNQTFAFESTLASRSFVKLLRNCISQSYQINLLFVWLNSPDLAVERVQQRIAVGGHAIPIDVIKRRYFRSMSNFMNLYLPLSDRWILCDNSNEKLVVTAQKHRRSKQIEIYDAAVWKKFVERKHE